MRRTCDELRKVYRSRQAIVTVAISSDPQNSLRQRFGGSFGPGIMEYRTDRGGPTPNFRCGRGGAETCSSMGENRRMGSDVTD